ncbi:hypothetical protein SAMN02745866_03448 [Alteromonadaceae bacterium Bs31]|nr:hypothetical protein SAMN02745866_03448 [Alteromonadaceae bacterium Bs31]
MASCTDDLGNFILPEVEAGFYELEVVRGAFKTSFTVDASDKEGPVSTQPIALSKDGPTAAKMAIVTGHFDRMENVLAKTGFGEMDNDGELILGTELFDIYRGIDTTDTSYPDFSKLLETNTVTGQAFVFDYDIVFLNCGVETDSGFFPGSLAADDEALRATLREYVQQGGRLYATDWSYDYIEQAFPEYLDFYGDHSDPNSAEQLEVASVGAGDQTVYASITDPNLIAFLSNATCETRAENKCLETDGSLYIEGFLPSWAIIDDAHENAVGVNFYARADVLTDEDEQLNRPLTASFPFGSGQVFYSSYHTEDIGSQGFLPQERVMQYLIFE